MSTKPVMAERDVEARFHRKVTNAGGLSFKVVSTGAGVPDRAVLYGGQTYWVELKRDGGRLSVAQRSWHAKAEARGVRVHVVWGPEGVDEWVAALVAGVL